MWRSTERHLVDRYAVDSPNLPGFAGDTAHFSLDEGARAIIELASRRDGAHLVGLSLGAAVAIRAVATDPRPFTSVMLCAPPIAPLRYQPHLLRRYRYIPDRAARVFSDAVSWRRLIDAVASIDLADDLAAIRPPTLVACGARDRASLPDARRAADGIPTAKLLVLPHLGHGWPVTAPRVFRSVLDNFLRSATGA